MFIQSHSLTDFWPVLHFIQKPAIWFEVEMKYLVSIWNTPLSWNGLNHSFQDSYEAFLLEKKNLGKKTLPQCLKKCLKSSAFFEPSKIGKKLPDLGLGLGKQGLQLSENIVWSQFYVFYVDFEKAEIIFWWCYGTRNWIPYKTHLPVIIGISDCWNSETEHH